VSDEFVGYVGDADLHDGVVRSVRQAEGTVHVIVQSPSGRQIDVLFDGVVSVEAHRAEGMRLYAVSEMAAAAPLRRFVFANWHEDDDARLEVVAERMRLDEGPGT
jgi:hypothetical protein